MDVNSLSKPTFSFQRKLLIENFNGVRGKKKKKKEKKKKDTKRGRELAIQTNLPFGLSLFLLKLKTEIKNTVTK